jgi:Na+/H+ antiporter NhaC
MISFHAATTVVAATTSDAKAIQDFKELFVQIGLALVIMGIAMAYLTARKKREARAAELALLAAKKKPQQAKPVVDKNAQARKAAQAKKATTNPSGSKKS